VRISTPPPETGSSHHLPEWVIPWSASLGLHLLLLLALTSWHRQPRDVIWVNLLDARLLTAGKQESQPRTPTVKPRLPQATPAVEQPRAKRRALSETPSASAAALPSLPAAPLASPAATADGSGPSAAETGVVKTVPAQATAGGDGAEDQKAAEPPEQRYVREQFAYIRERVMQRLNYPPMARRQGWQGTVRVAFTVRADGSIVGLHVAAGSGHPLLDRQALRAVESAAPFPAPPAAAAITLPVLFSLEPPRP
jgi:protein TonB